MMNKLMMLGRAQLGHQRVDVHAVAKFRCDLARFVKKMADLIAR